MSVLAAFMSTWSSARATFGEDSPQTGAGYDHSAALRQLENGLTAAAPGNRWTGTAASAYDAANAEHRRVFGELADLDRRLRAHIDHSAAVVSAGRAELDAVRKWVVDAASSVPQNAAGDRLLAPIVRKGITDVIEIIRRSNGDLNAIGAEIHQLGAEYQALAEQKFGKP